MNQSSYPQYEMVSFTKPSMVLYVEDTYNAAVNAFIQSNYHQIIDYYEAKGIDFCYLPYLFQNSNYQAVVNYNRPYLLNDINENSIVEIYRKIKNKLSEMFEGTGLILIDEISDKYESDFGFPLLLEESIIDQFEKIASLCEQKIDEKFLRESDNKPMFKIIGPKNEDDFDLSILSEHKIDYESEITEKKSFSNICYSIELDADIQFDYEAYRLADEIRTRIQLLKESGSLSLIGDLLEEIQGESKKLSTVFITNDYRIFLKEYGMKEIVMPPLPKSLFILFLRHPEGILFKRLSDYHDELLSIYRNLTVHENIDRAMESIRAMTDPLNNSINEKCSRIRAAFLEVITEDLAQYYYVTGKRGEAKKIILDRTLVEFQ